MSRKKKRKTIKYRDIELNIMPFIDVFSLLNTFLLMSAVFLAIGVLEVQIPFLTSAPPDTKDNERAFDVKVDVTKENPAAATMVEVTTSWSRAPIDEQKRQFKMTKEDMAAMHKYLVDVRRAHPDTDKVSFFTDDDVLWKDIALVLDAVKLRGAGDPIFATKAATDIEKAVAAEFLFPKVVMASVML